MEDSVTFAEDSVAISAVPTPFPTKNVPIPPLLVVLEAKLAVGTDGDVKIEFELGSTIANCTNPREVFKAVAAGSATYLKPIPARDMGEKRLSAQGEYLTCFVVRLSNSVSWQFSKTGAPFCGHQGVTLNDFCTNVFRVDANGNDIANSASVSNCRTAYFVVNGGECIKYGGGKYDVPYFFNVDLKYTSGGVEHLMPLMIDPEIRWPGGTKPPQ